MRYLKLTMLIISVCFLSACQLLGGEMGRADYTIKPFLSESGEIICCEAHIFNTKDYDGLKVVIKRNKDGTVEVTLDETGVSASDPAKMAAESNSKLLEVLAEIVGKD